VRLGQYQRLSYVRPEAVLIRRYYFSLAKRCFRSILGVSGQRKQTIDFQAREMIFD
jgi:hypothetical protein